MGCALYQLQYEETVIRTTEVLEPVTSKFSTANATREQRIINAIHHAWRGYAHYALDTDELLPLSKMGQNNWGHLQWTLCDALDTLHLAGLEEELKLAHDQLQQSSFRQNSVVSTFEMTIRLLGGTLSAYELTHDPLYLEKAKDIGHRILGAFGVTSGLPLKQLHLIFGHPIWLGTFQTRTNSLAGCGSLQLELSHLSYVTKDPKFSRAGRGALDALRRAHKLELAEQSHLLEKDNHLYPFIFNVDTGNTTSSDYVTMGSGADSFYEYLLKLYILEGGEDKALLQMYIHAMDDMIKYLVKDFDIAGEKASILISVIGRYPLKKMEHLTCFVPGMLALGAHYGQKFKIPELQVRYEEHMRVAQGLIKTCAHFYTRNPSGLSADEYEWDAFTASSLRIVDGSEGYKLRPETVESLFVLYRVTGDEQYRELGWTIFQAIEKNCRTEVAYAAVKDVRKVPVVHEDKMESFMLGETLKYLQLLFADKDVISLNEYVFTTEAHPLPIHKFPYQSHESISECKNENFECPEIN